jgi:hypothetical protein
MSVRGCGDMFRVENTKAAFQSGFLPFFPALSWSEGSGLGGGGRDGKENGAERAT